MRNRAQHLRPSIGGGPADGAEIHMRGDIGLARMVQGVLEMVPLDRLQGVAARGFGVPADMAG